MSDDKTSKSFTITQRSGKTHTVIVDADRYDEFAQCTLTVISVNALKTYVICNKSGNKGYLHHFVIGKPPAGMVTDHINGNPMDNRVCNLRHCTPSQNILNRDAVTGSLTGTKGITYNWRHAPNCRWNAICKFNGKAHLIGRYPSAVLALNAYNEFGRKHMGEFFRPSVLDAEKVAAIEAKYAADIAAKEAAELTCGTKGIYPSNLVGKPWLVKITASGKRHYLGCFPTVEAARAARNEFLAQHTEAR